MHLSYRYINLLGITRLRNKVLKKDTADLLLEGREYPNAHNPRIKTITKILIIVWGNFSPKFPSLYIQVPDMKFSVPSRYQRYHTLRSDWFNRR